jgi:hypothetical protein
MAVFASIFGRNESLKAIMSQHAMDTAQSSFCIEYTTCLLRLCGGPAQAPRHSRRPRPDRPTKSLSAQGF